MSMSFAEQFREEVKKQGLTLEMVAQTCGTSLENITLIERGERLPGRKILPKIAVALGVKMPTVLNWYLVDVGQKTGLEEIN